MAIITGRDSGGITRTIRTDSDGRIEFVGASYPSKNIYNSTSIGSGSSVNVVSYTVPANKELSVHGLLAGGPDHALIKLNIDGSTKLVLRNSGSNRTVSQELFVPEILSTSTVVSINITNEGDFTQSFEGTLFATERDV
jgi:hypothetical protein